MKKKLMLVFMALLLVLTLVGFSDEEEPSPEKVDAAFTELDEANEFFVQFMTRVTELKEYYGFYC